MIHVDFDQLIRAARVVQAGLNSPSADTADRAFLDTLKRACLARFAAQAIAALDAMDGDPDLEADTSDFEDEHDREADEADMGLCPTYGLDQAAPISASNQTIH